jgi:anthranilate synthase/aminodeoxychorismate synthase-like glutamine amidotransferase
MILLIDNYDSFVHNLARYLGELGCETEVVRNDAAPIQTLFAKKPDAIIISPGPCAPAQAGISVDLVRQALKEGVPLLGVCLGHQCIAEAFNGQTIRAKSPRHGKTSLIAHEGHALFQNLPNPFPAARYHSLVSQIDPEGPLEPIATSTDDLHLMAVAHATQPIFGVQFHPESILTTAGHQILANFLDLAGASHRAVPSDQEKSA